MFTIPKLITLTLIIFSFIFLVQPTFAQDPDYDQINEIAENLNCPTCTGINLADCQTLTCEQWRDQISELVAQGYTEQEVLDYFADRYGTQVLQEPPRSGFTLILWVLPVLALLLGGGWLLYTMRGWAKAPATPAAPVSTPPTLVQPSSSQAPSHYLSQVEKDLGLGE